MGNDLAPVLVTGAAGYLGGHVLANLKERGVPLVATGRTGNIGTPCDLTDMKKVRGLLEQVKPSIIIHSAAVVPKSQSAYDDSSSAEASVAMVKNIAEAAACPVVFVSSMTVYTGAGEFPVTEDDLHPPVTGYAYGKWQAEQLLFGRDFRGDVALRLPGLFGLPRRSGLLYNAAKAFLVHGDFKFSSSPGLWAAMAVGDAAEYVVRAALTTSDYPPQAVNAGYEGEFSIPDAVAEIAALCRVDWESPSTPVAKFSMNLERLKTRYGILPATFRQRLEELVEIVGHDLELERRGDLNAN